jgi:hypothetical protein
MNILYPGRMIGDGINVRPSNLISDEGDDPGNGLFATMAFRQGDVITTYDGEVISSTLAKALDQQTGAATDAHEEHRQILGNRRGDKTNCARKRRRLIYK